MKLIYADELKELYEDYEGLKVPCEVVLQNIDDMPTAYDIDEKVSKLEELIEENVGYLRATPEANAYIKAIRDAIEIVKGRCGMISLKDAIYELNHNIEFKNARMVTEGEVAIYLEELQRYADLEEQGRLIELPCAVGDTVYYPEKEFNFVYPVKISEIILSDLGNGEQCFQFNGCFFDGNGDPNIEFDFDNEDFGNIVFLTKEEAEAALKESEKE